MGRKRDIHDPYFNTEEILAEYPEALDLTDEAPEEEDIFLIDQAHWDLGTMRVMKYEKRQPYIGPGEPLLDFFRFAFSKMAQHSKEKERYAIGYARFSRKALKQGASLSNAVEDQVFYSHSIPSYKEQEKAIRTYSVEKGFTLFHTFTEVQAGREDAAFSLEVLSIALHLCELNDAAFIYCDTGSFNKFPEFFTRINAAKKSGVHVIPIADDDALLSVIKNSRKKGVKPRPQKEEREAGKAKHIALAYSKYPILEWKADSPVSTKRFNHFEYLFNGHYPIYRYFLSPETRNETNPEKWGRNPLSFEKLATSLNEMGFYTVGGLPWNKQTTRKVKDEIIFSKLFSEYSLEKFAIAENIQANKRDEAETEMAERYGVGLEDPEVDVGHGIKLDKHK